MASQAQLSPEESIALIKANLVECLNPEIIENIILKEKRPLKVYWGTATTGRPHCGYFVPLMKIAELLAAGCEVKILLADLHGYLDAMKAPLELVTHRAKYYEFVIKSTLTALGVDIEKLIFVMGTSYQLKPEYIMDVFKLGAITNVKTAIKAGAEVVKQAEDPALNGLIYPLMQALDEEHLGVDAQFGGLDQRKIFTFALENLPKIGYKTRAHLMNPMVPGLGAAEKMSASDEDSKIDLLDDPDKVAKKMKKAVCTPKKVEGNGVLAFVEHVIFRALTLKNGKEAKVVIERKDGAETLVYTSMAKLKDDYAADIVTPQLLKATLVKYLNDLLAPIRADFDKNKEWQEEQAHGYPVVEEIKFKKVKKDKGDPELRAKALAARTAKTSDIDTKPDGHVEGEGAEKANVGPKSEELLQNLHVTGS